MVAFVRRKHSAILETHHHIQIEQADLAAGAAALPVGPFDALLHCAAAIPSAVPDETELTRINVEGSCRLFEHAIKSGAGVIVFCSSMAVYGRINVDMVEPGYAGQRPRHSCGACKLVSERYA